MAGRTWRTAGFADLRDNNNDVEMPDVRADVSRLPHSSRHQREGIYGVTPRPPPSTPDVRAMAKVTGISVDFREGESGTGTTNATTKTPKTPDTDKAQNMYEDRYQKMLSATRPGNPNEDLNAHAFLGALVLMTGLPNEDGKSATKIPLELNLSQTFDAQTAYATLKRMMWNFKKGDFGKDLMGIPDSRVKATVSRVIQKKADRLEALHKALLSANDTVAKEFDYATLQPKYEYEKREAVSPTNMLELKSIIDAINVAAENIANSTTNKAADVARQEPPFFPRLSEDERMTLYNWIKIKQAALDDIYRDPLYIFAVKVAGLSNMSDFSIDKLITSAYKQTPSYAQFQQMPSTIADDPFLSNERTVLFDRIVGLNEDLEKSKIQDLLAFQQKQNVVKENEDQDDEEVESVTTRMEINRRRYAQMYGAQDSELPVDNALVVDLGDKAIPESLKTRELRLHVEALKGLTSAYESGGSRQRMLWAVQWMMQPEILKRAELSPLFVAAMSAALTRVRSMCPTLAQAKDAKMFYESPDDIVVDVFAELVAMQIARIKFFHPTRVLLDKTGARTQQVEGRLLYRMKNFSFDGSKVFSDLALTGSRGGTCSALYAF